MSTGRIGETGDERVLASAQCIVLATRSDLDGEVEIEVRIGDGPDAPTAGPYCSTGELLTTGQGILVGNSLIDLHPGWAADRLAPDPHLRRATQQPRSVHRPARGQAGRRLTPSPHVLERGG
jgi:hypothetical protein